MKTLSLALNAAITLFFVVGVMLSILTAPVQAQDRETVVDNLRVRGTITIEGQHTSVRLTDQGVYGSNFSIDESGFYYSANGVEVWIDDTAGVRKAIAIRNSNTGKWYYPRLAKRGRASRN